MERAQTGARVAAPLLMLMFACGDTRALPSPDLLAPIATGRSVVFVDRSDHVATLLDTDAIDAEPTRTRLPQSPTLPVPRPGAAHETLVLCRGASDDPRNEDEAAALVVLNQEGEARRYPLSTRFNAMKVSDDGRYAMLYFNDTAASDSLIFNPNEIAIVDLDAEFVAVDDVENGNSNPRSRTLRSFGSAPSHIVFSPELMVAGDPRRLAVVLFDTVVLLIDLDHLDRPEYTIELATSSDRTIDLAQVVFDAARGRLYLRGDASNDVYVLTLTPSAGGDNDYAPSLNQLGIGAVPHDMALYNTDEEPRLLAITSSAQAVVVDANTSRTTAIPLPVTATGVRIFTAESPFDPIVEPRALLYAHGSSSVMFLDLRDVEERRARNLETLRVQSSYNVSNELDDNLILLIHASTGLSVLNLAERTASPIRSNQSLANALSDPAAEKLWLAPSGQAQLGFLDLRDFHPGAVDLERPIDSLVRIGGEGPPRLAVVHESEVGHVTLIDSDDPTDLTRATAVRGFLLHNIFDRIEQEAQ